MPVIALVGNKGGAGKTTLCINLASALAERGATVVLDADPQQSSHNWHAISDGDGAFPVISASEDVAAAAEHHAEMARYVLVDCPPSVHSQQTSDALSRADLALIPVQPSPLDLWASVQIEAEVDLVVLAIGMESNHIGDLVEMMKLPTGVDRFLQEVHPKLRPVELANTGILLAGTCQAPMDIGEACSAAQAASAKATSLLARGYVELDPFVAQVDPERCSGAGQCAEVCPIDDAIVLADVRIEGQMVKRARVNPALCTGCGICVAVCPDNAVDIKGWTLRQYEEMVDAIVAA